MRTRISVVVASNNKQFLDQARAGISPGEAIRIVGEAREAWEALDVVSRRKPTLLILDLGLPPAGGLPVLSQMRKRRPGTQVLAVDGQLDEAQMLMATKAGAHGYMLAEAIPAHLAKAIRVMTAGETWLGRKLMTKVVEELQRLYRLHERRRRRRGGMKS